MGYAGEAKVLLPGPGVTHAPISFRESRIMPRECGSSGPNGVTHATSSSRVTADTQCIDVRFVYSGANLSLTPPRHRCYALLSSALSRHVRETRPNSYVARQDGLW